MGALNPPNEAGSCALSRVDPKNPFVLVVGGGLGTFCSRLEGSGIPSRFIGDATEALAIVQKERTALVLVDVHAHGMDGLQLLQEIREISPPNGMVPFIVITASRKEEEIVRYLQAGADDCIASPFSPHVLLERIRRFMARR